MGFVFAEGADLGLSSLEELSKMLQVLNLYSVTLLDHQVAQRLETLVGFVLQHLRGDEGCGM